jgi:hypothetical protein
MVPLSQALGPKERSVGNLALALIAISIVVALLALAGLIQFPKFSAKLFASRIDHTVGSVKLLNSGSSQNSIDVHVLGGTSPPEWIGLTIKNNDFANSTRTTPVTLSVAEARQLSELLARASQTT